MSLQQLENLVNLIKSSPPLANPDVKAMRVAAEQMGALLPVDPEVKFTPVQAASVPAEWAEMPGARAPRVILYLHGGGYVSGSIAVYRSLAARLSKAAKARVFSIDYRLAPEHPFPAAVEDSVASYRWLLGQKVKPELIAIAGDSAGGGLAAATLVAIRDAGLPRPAAGVLLSPMVDLEGTGESMISKAAEDPMVRKENVAIVRLYLDGCDPRTPLAAPLYADLVGLPPLLIQVGTSECLLDDSVRLAERARQAQVEVTLERWDRMIHVWQLFAPILDEGQQAIDGIGDFVQTHAR
ncbi:MAG: alpha/beta hydrolase [Deltaproteobacteria bacterium]|jgi:epsilon-lactone hydrolase|nr:alpha/beta hydrolase [Deltaproteobacteria bacterium]